MLTEMANELKTVQWIRPAGMQAGDMQHAQAALFRKEVTLAGGVKRAVLRVSAADRYRLYVNGKSVVCGPRKGDRWNRYYETVDIAPYLKEGANYITARVISYGDYNAGSMEAAPYSVYVSNVGAVLMALGAVEMENGECVALCTGKTEWTAAQDDSFATHGSSYVGATERFYAENCPDWRENKPMGWAQAEVAYGTGINEYGEFPSLQLKARAIPNMEEIENTFAGQLENLEGERGFQFDENGTAIIPPHSKMAVELDAGVLRTAYLRLPVQGAGAKVTVVYAERYFPEDAGTPTGPMRRDDRVNGSIRGNSDNEWSMQFDEIFPADKEALFESFWFRTFRYIRIEVETAGAAATLRMPDFIETRYPLNVTAQLTFPNERMAQLWDIAVRTLRSCMHETHEDCPYYEQLQYTLDTRLQMQFTYAIAADTRMAENVLWDYHCSQLNDGILQSRTPCVRTQVIPDFSIYWIYMLEEHYIQTGDASLIRFYRTTMDKMLDYFDRHVNADGLVENLGYWEFGDWVETWNPRRGVPDATWEGPSTLHNLTYALGLRTAARLMRVIGKDLYAKDYDDRADQVCASVVKLCWDEQRGVLREGPKFEQYSQHSQALAALSGALTGERAENAMRHAMEDEDMLPCTFPWQYTLFRALDKVGLYGMSEPVWEQYFAMLDRHLTTIPEKPGDTRSDCHAWSALPLYEYPRMLLGVQPAEAGWESVLVYPHAIGIDRLSGSVPTPKGAVKVDWHLENGKMHVNVDAPVPVKVVVDGRIYEDKNGKFSI